jgi:hypothetical protein
MSFTNDPTYLAPSISYLQRHVFSHPTSSIVTADGPLPVSCLGHVHQRTIPYCLLQIGLRYVENQVILLDIVGEIAVGFIDTTQVVKIPLLPEKAGHIGVVESRLPRKVNETPRSTQCFCNFASMLFCCRTSLRVLAKMKCDLSAQWHLHTGCNIHSRCLSGNSSNLIAF